MKYYCENIDTVLKQTESSAQGLSTEEAGRRLLQNGRNKLAEGKKDSIFVRFLKQLADPMIIILLVAALISGALAAYEGESFTDVIIILAVVIFNAVLGVYQENKAEKAIEALQEMAAATSKVIRDGKLISVKSEELVVGDIVVLEAGDAVPADGRLIENASLKIEEAALTGESVPVNKFIDIINLKDSSKEVPLGDRANMVYMGSTVVYGRGVAVITATGMDTEMGKIADALVKAEEGQTPLQMKLSQLSKILTWLVLGICVLIFGVQLVRAGGFTFDVVMDSFMVAVSLAVAAIPEGLAAVVTVVLSMGVGNMSKRNAIIRKLTAVETLGCAQIICSDKTGTLTQNKMTVVDSFCENAELLASAMSLCSDAELNSDGTVTGEPTEAALVEWAKKIALLCQRIHPAKPLQNGVVDRQRLIRGGKITAFGAAAPALGHIIQPQVIAVIIRGHQLRQNSGVAAQHFQSGFVGAAEVVIWCPLTFFVHPEPFRILRKVGSGQQPGKSVDFPLDGNAGLGQPLQKPDVSFVPAPRVDLLRGALLRMGMQAQELDAAVLNAPEPSFIQLQRVDDYTDLL